MENLGFVSFEPQNGNFKGFITMDVAFDSNRDPQMVLQEAINVYTQAIAKLQSILKELELIKSRRETIPARKIWQIGNVIFKLKDSLEILGLQLDSMYKHLTRDLGVKKKWLEKVIILRRYIENEEIIPQSLNWGRCEKGTRKVAKKISEGTYSI